MREKEISMTIKKNKHMTLNDRIEIEDCLRHGMTFKAIGARIGKDQTTVSKEVKKHISVSKGYDSEKSLCDLLLRAPYVCNGCQKRRSCRLEKHIYRARNAHSEYRDALVDSRTGVALNKEAFYRADEILYDGVKNKGQHIYHVVQTHNLGMSVSSVYRNISKGYLSVSKMDLPRAVKFKPRKDHSSSEYVPAAVKKGHLYSDFLNYIEEHGIEDWVEMDTVIGRIGGKAIMTFDFTDFNFMFGLLLENKSAAAASDKMTSLKIRLNEHGIRFGDIFPLMLCDNGGEFSNINSFMNDCNGEKEAELFFCEPYRSCEKPRVEKNHTLFRDICPKGTSFDSFTQEDVNFIFSHVNSIKRKKLHKKTPYEMFSFTYGESLARLLGITAIAAEEVCQSPSLLKRLPSLR